MIFLAATGCPEIFMPVCAGMTDALLLRDYVFYRFFLGNFLRLVSARALPEED